MCILNTIGSGFFSKLAPFLIGAGAFVAGWFAKE